MEDFINSPLESEQSGLFPISTEIERERQLEEKKFMETHINKLETKVDQISVQMNELDKKINDISGQMNKLDKKILIIPTLPKIKAIYTMFIVLVIIIIYAGFLIFRGWFLPPEAQFKVSYNYTVDVGEIIGLTLGGIGIALAGVGFIIKYYLN